MNGPEAATWVTAGAAVVQAVTAIVIVGLTVWLARIARAALRESDRQAKIAEAALKEAAQQTVAAMRANDEARKQRQLGAIPLLDVMVDASHHFDDARGLMTDFVVRNPGPNNALDVRLLVYGMTSDHRVEETERCRSKPIPLLGAGDQDSGFSPDERLSEHPEPWASSRRSDVL
jgi:hypothetical protein